jgi:neutral ceramidase
VSTSFHIGFAVEDITPGELFTNWVHGQPYPGILDRLSVKAVALEIDGQRGLILGFDLLETRRVMVAKLREALAGLLDIPPAAILTNATHTHSSPRFPFSPKDTHPSHMDKLQALHDDPRFATWCGELFEKTVRCAQVAFANRRPASLSIRRIYAGDWVYNRRPIKPDGTVETEFSTNTPLIQSGGRRFGQCDPTMTALQFSDGDSRPIASLLHFACHSVAIYPFDQRISADWPGLLCKKLSDVEGGGALFLQGCAGDQVPARRGQAAAEEMTNALVERLTQAAEGRASVASSPFRAASEMLELPLRDGGTIAAEVQALRLGDAAIVALPGEPLIGLNLDIQDRSPFPHTLCLGYSNGHGTAYVGREIDWHRGGYEALPRVCHGAAECGGRLVASGARLLAQLK